MRFFTSSLLAIATLAGSVFAAGNPISKPDGSAPLVAGESVTITWTPTTPGPITLIFRQGPPTDLKDVSVIVSGADNSGSYTWTVPKGTASGDNYAIQIVDDKTKDDNYTPPLPVKSEVAPSSSSSSSSATSSSTSSGSSSSSSATTTTSKPEMTSKPAHNSTMITSTTSASNATMSTTGSSNATTTRGSGAGSSSKPTSPGGSGASSTGPSSSAPTAPSSGAVALVMNSPLALVVCVLGAVMYLN
ncbi:unnamed protein product [Tuber aestivum]|uniref:Yeast cell wall synthesis Kre9/Knh1-like N-terminal domain-containing protein n=1 Tax=Tuber aestivum TaxID=59557 RepID=A0A292Q1N0_9PEZI|nr:unnamed protein product [Tuber aestivum]